MTSTKAMAIFFQKGNHQTPNSKNYNFVSIENGSTINLSTINKIKSYILNNLYLDDTKTKS